MRLLQKSVVSKDISDQRKQQIDEGIAIAQKIDKLRETLLSLQKQHDDFIAGIRADLEEKTKFLFEEITTRKLELENLERQRQQLLLPFTAEWEQVNLEKQRLQQFSGELSLFEANLKKDQEKLDELIKQEKERVFKAKAHEKALEKALIKAETNEQQTSTTLWEAHQIKSNSILEAESRKKELDSREANVAVKERENQLVKESNERETVFISEEKTRLAFERVVLEKAMKRYNKQ